MSKKISSYRKLKEQTEAERIKLLSDIRTLVFEHDSVKGIELNIKYRVLFQTNDAMWSGATNKIN